MLKKRLISILLIMAVLLMFSSCKKSENNDAESTESPNTQQETVAPTSTPTPEISSKPNPTIKPDNSKEEKPNNSKGENSKEESKVQKEHYHKFTVQDCTHPSVCSVCGIKGAEPLGHLWVEATCTTPKTCARCKVTEGVTKSHIWKAATCTNPQVCTLCGAINGSALGHTGGTATCKEQAKCTRCGEFYGDKKSHTPNSEVTCTQDSVCKDCGEIIQKAAGHKWEEATCATAKYCTVCKVTEGTPTEHSFGEWQTIKEVTCEENGERERTCTVCSLQEKEIIEPKGHSWVEADCETPKHCSVCAVTEGDALGHVAPDKVDCGTYPICKRCQKEFGDKKEHNWTNASCTSPATCTDCGAVGESAVGHYGGEPTCTAPGKCKSCGAEYLPVIDHKWIEATCIKPKHCEFCGIEEGTVADHKWIEATCEKAKYCEICGLEEGTPKAHTFVDATCTAKKHCSVCGYEEGEVLPHNFAEATCKNDRYCLGCGFVEENTKTEHNMSDWVIIQEKTCVLDEIKQKKCSNCDFTIEEKTATTGHTWIDADCENPKRCSVCNATEGNPLGHRGGEATTTNKAKCEVCGKEYGELLPVDEIYTVYDLNTRKEVTDTLENLVAQIVQNEMGGGFDAEALKAQAEALKAQAVAARSWLMYQNKGRIVLFNAEEKQSRSIYPEVGLKTPNQASIDAAKSTRGQYVSYNGAVALTPYFACSNGWTQGSQEAWNSSIPYLVAVESKYDSEATSYVRTKTIAKDVLKVMLSDFIDGLEFDKYEEKDWVEIISKTSGNYNDLMRVCGKTSYISKLSGKTITIKGKTIQSILELRSPDFRVDYDSDKDAFDFTTHGWGHGCGMSQWGAHLYAVKEGMTYTDILSHYFPGTQLSNKNI